MKKEKRVKVVNWFENNFKILDSLFENVQLLDYLNHKKNHWCKSYVCNTKFLLEYKIHLSLPWVTFLWFTNTWNPVRSDLPKKIFDSQFANNTFLIRTLY